MELSPLNCMRSFIILPIVLHLQLTFYHDDKKSA